MPSAIVYRWAEKDTEHKGGRVHAKIALADNELVFISSANFTGHAIERNFEAGVLIKGGVIPQDVSRHLNGPIDLKTISRAKQSSR